jgi:peptidoglycan/LPS O-acetylase OafA/YrhL
MITVFNGGIAVYLFFVLSGAVLVASLLGESSIGPRSMVNFVGRRVFRIMPLTIVSVVAFGALSYLSLPAVRTEPFSLSNIIENSLLMNYSVNGATWTLQIEMLMVPVIALAAWSLRRWGVFPLIALLMYTETFIFRGAPRFLTPNINIAATAFVLGMMIPTPMMAQAFQRAPVLLAGAALAGIGIVRFWYPIESVMAVLIILGLCLIAVATLYHSQSPRSVFDWPAFTFLGRISFSVYLLHPIVIYELFPHFAPLLDPIFGVRSSVSGLVLTAVFVGLTVPVSACCERYLERPSNRLGHRLFPTRQIPRLYPTPAASAAIAS